MGTKDKNHLNEGSFPKEQPKNMTNAIISADDSNQYKYYYYEEEEDDDDGGGVVRQW